jgi:hypothetical protein
VRQETSRLSQPSLPPALPLAHFNPPLLPTTILNLFIHLNRNTHPSNHIFLLPLLPFPVLFSADSTSSVTVAAGAVVAVAVAAGWRWVSVGDRREVRGVEFAGIEGGGVGCGKAGAGDEGCFRFRRRGS